LWKIKDIEKEISAKNHISSKTTQSVSDSKLNKKVEKKRAEQQLLPIK